MSNWPEPYLAPTNAKREHYVPKRMLEHFAVEGLVGVYEIVTGSTFKTSPKNAAVASRFYDLRVGGVDLSLESWLAEIEGLVAPILERLIKNVAELVGLSDADRELVARFIALQELRSPGQRWIEAQMRRKAVDNLKEIGQIWLRSQFGDEEAREVWDEWKTKPDDWFLNESHEHQPSATTARMAESAPGFGNVLQAMPWRIGRVAGQSLYTSDSPVSKLPRSKTRFTVYFENVFYIPLAPDALLRIGPGLTADKKRKDIVSDFDRWETSMAKHVITQNATRHLFGPGPYVSRLCGERCLVRLGKTPASKVASF